MEREQLVVQMARAFAGDDATPIQPEVVPDALRHKADEALARVESYLGIEIEEAKEIVAKVLEDIP